MEMNLVSRFIITRRTTAHDPMRIFPDHMAINGEMTHLSASASPPMSSAQYTMKKNTL